MSIQVKKRTYISIAVGQAVLSMSLNLQAGGYLEITDAKTGKPLGEVFNEAQTPVVAVNNVQQIADRVLIEVDKDGLPADGQSASEISIKIVDRNGLPLKNDVMITVEHSAGRLLLPNAKTDELGLGGLDLDKVSPGVQMKVSNGLARFKLIAPSSPQDVHLKITHADIVVNGDISFLPELRDMLAAGLIEGVISKKSISAGSLSPSRRNDGFEQEINRWSRQFNNGKANYAMRTAFFVKGEISGKTLITAAYDSDKATRARILRDIRPDQFYPVYGDSSIQAFDARSSDRLYVRIDKDKSYALYGDFATGSGFSQRTGGGDVASIQTRNLGQYNRTATGLRGHYEKNGITGNAFVISDSLKQAIEEYPANGTSGPFAVSNNSALENSEKVEIVTRDKNQLNIIKKVETLNRFEDYSFEPFSGRILLRTPLMSLSPEGDPQFLRITYEVDQGGEDFIVAGVDGQLEITKGLEVGGSIVDDANPLSPYKLQSANVTLSASDKDKIVLEVARSESTEYANGNNLFSTPTGSAGEAQLDRQGNAFRVEAISSSDEKSKLQWSAKGWHAQSDKEFSNQAASFERGRGESGVKGILKLTEKLSLNGEAIESRDDVLESERSGQKVGVTAKINEELTVGAFARRVKEDSAIPDAFNRLSNNLVGGANSPLGNSAGVTGGFYGLGVDQQCENSSIKCLSPIGSVGAASGPVNIDATTVGIEAQYSPTKTFTLDGLYESGDENVERAVAGARYKVTENVNLYARAETQTGLASAFSINPGERSNAFTAGVDSTYMKNGTMFSEYRLRDALSNQQATLTDMQLANGVRNLWFIDEGLTATTGIEYLNILRGGNRDAMSLVGGLDYTANPLWKASTKLEYRKLFDNDAESGNQAQEQYLSTIAFARKLDQDWTFLTRNYLLITDNNQDAAGARKGDAIQDRFQIGAAWRPVDNNTFNALFRYEFRLVKDESTPTGDDYTSSIISTHADYHPSRPWWTTTRFAMKFTDDNTLPSEQIYTAYLVSGRVVYDVTEKWDIGFLGSMLYSPQGDSKQYASGLEVGYQLKTNLWASLGYNWTGFFDNELSASDYTSEGIYARLRFKFDENLFDSDNKDINRTLSK